MKNTGTALLYFCLTSAPVYLGVVFGYYYLPRVHRPSTGPKAETLVEAFAVWDGYWFAKIATEGYSYSAHEQSSVAFFPAYPLLGRWLMYFTPWGPTVALLVVSHVLLAATFVLLFCYVRSRCGDSPSYCAEYSLLAFGLWPATFYFRMTYSEPLLLFLCVAALYGMERRWPMPIIAGIIGLATATRPVGVALLVPLVLHIWDRTHDWKPFFRLLVYLLPIACWGLGAYILYQAIALGEPLAFTKTQDQWRERPEELSLTTKILALETLEPIWSNFDPSSLCYWQRLDDGKTHALLSLQVANPVFFLLTVAAIAFGTWKRWLSRYEWALAWPLLLIPYLTRSSEMCMASFARFAAMAFPFYLVLGNILCRTRPPLVGVFLGLSGFVLGVYAALFVAGFRFF